MKTKLTFIHYCFLTISCIYYANFLNAQNTFKQVSTLENKEFCFIRNRGQLTDKNNNLLNQIKYYGNYKGVNYYLQDRKLSFVYSKYTPIKNSAHIDDIPEAFMFKKLKKYQVDFLRMDMEFLGANPNVMIQEEQQVQQTYNFYKSHLGENGLLNIHGFSKITYKSIYHLIDLVIELKGEGIEYSFIVYPGGNVNDIQIRWTGANDILLAKDGGIQYHHALGEMHESRPISYNDSKMVKSSFILHDNIVSFNIDNYNKNKLLVIDPKLIWASYFGVASEVCWNSTLDDSNYIYLGGYTGTTAGFATSGAHQTTIGSTYDAFLAKVGDNGKPIWCTYYGGNYDDEIKSLTMDDSGYIYVAGSTFSTSGIGTTGTYHPTGVPGGFEDGFIAKFKTNGSRVWGTYVGGNSGDNCTGIACDKSGGVYITGYTLSTSGLATSGAYRTSLAGSYDAYIAAFTGNGGQTWSSYFGDTGPEYTAGIATDDSGGVYFCGVTSGTKNIATPGSFQNSLGGSRDAFLCKFTSLGNFSWGTYYGGSKFELGSGVKTDKHGYVYLSGITYSTNAIASKNAFQSYMAGDTDAFLAKFNSSGQRIWGTYCGGPGHDEAGGVSVDNFGNIYLHGTTRSTSGIATTNAFQSTNSGDYDCFIYKFNDQGKRIWASYFGGNDADFPGNVDFDGNSTLYLTGWTMSTTGIATPGAYNTFLPSSHNTAFVAKIGSPIQAIDASIISLYIKDSICAGPKDIYTKIKNYGTDDLTSASINFSINGKLQTPYSWKGNLKTLEVDSVYLGNFFMPSNNDTVIVWSSIPNGRIDSIAENDTIISSYYFKPLPTPSISGSPFNVCINDSTIYRTPLTSSPKYQWTISGANPNFKSTLNDNYVVVYWQAKGTGNLKVVETNQYGCIDSASAKVKVLDKPNPSISGNKNICQGNAAVFATSKDSGTSYTWTSTGGNILSGASSDSVNILWPNSGNYTVKVIGKNIAGCMDSAIYNVTVSSAPKPTISGPGTACKGVTLKYSTKINSGSTYQWISNGGSTLSGTTSDSIEINWANTGSFSLKVIETNAAQCIDSISKNITIYDFPTPSIVGTNKVCQGINLSYQTKNNAGSTYSWSAPGGAIISGSNTANLNIKWTSSGNYRIVVTETNLEGCKDTAGISILVNPKPNSGWSYSNLTGLTYEFVAQDSNQNSYIWNFGDTKSGNSFKQSHTYTAEGNYTVSLLVINKEGCRDSASKSVKAVKIGIESPLQNVTQFQVYPNPFNEKFDVLYTLKQSSKISFNIYDIQGKLIYTYDENFNNNGEHRICIDANKINLLPGIYIIELQTENELLKKQIVHLK